MYRSEDSFLILWRASRYNQCNAGKKVSIGEKELIIVCALIHHGLVSSSIVGCEAAALVVFIFHYPVQHSVERVGCRQLPQLFMLTDPKIHSHFPSALSHTVVLLTCQGASLAGRLAARVLSARATRPFLPQWRCRWRRV